MRSRCWILALLLAFSTAPAFGIIVHHCDYQPIVAGGGVHDHHQDKGCSNMDVDTEDGVTGHCDHQTAFFWTDMDCDENGCQMSGMIDCPNGDKSYNFTCSGPGAKAFALRSFASCEAGQEAGQTYVTHSCSCDYG